MSQPASDSTPKPGSHGRHYRPRYRPARQLPASLRDTFKIVLEEELYPQAIDLLTSIISQGVSSSSDAQSSGADKDNSNAKCDAPLPPIYIPPPVQLTLYTTLLAHPHFTTHISRSRGPDSVAIPSACERLLLRLLALAGPHSMDLRTAWGRFSGPSNTSSTSDSFWARRRVVSPPPVADDSPFEDNKLDLTLAGRESLFERAEDFWGIVGWAFTCACAKEAAGGMKNKEKMMRRRWGAWKRVLRVMIEGLERDWEERLAMAEEEVDDKKREKILKRSLVGKYLPSRAGSAGYQRLLRAVMANGKGRLGVLEWREIWKDETQSLKEIRQRKERTDLSRLVPLSSQEEKGARKRGLEESGSEEELEEAGEEEEETEEDGEVAEEENRRGDGDEEMPDADAYSDSMPGLEFEKPKPTSRRRRPPSTVDAWGGIEAMVLRHRLLALMSSVCATPIFIPLPTFHSELSDHLLSFPPSDLSLFLSPLLPHCPPPYQFSSTPSPPSTSPPSPSLSLSLFRSSYLTIHLHPLISSLFRCLLSSEAPDSESISFSPPPARKTNSPFNPTYTFRITPAILTSCYLPYSAKSPSPADNTRVSILLELLVRMLAPGGALTTQDGGAELVAAMEDGIERRDLRISEGAGGGGGGVSMGRAKGRGKEKERELKEWEDAKGRLRAMVECVCCF